MSVILKALKSAGKEPEEGQEPLEEEINENDGGFFEGKEAFIKKNPLPAVSLAKNKTKISRPLIQILIGFLVVMFSFAATFWFITKPKTQSKIIPNTIEIIDTQNLPVTDVASAEKSNITPQDLMRNASNAYQNNNYDLSLTLFKKALLLDPDNARLHNNIGLVFADKGLFSNASSSFQKALELDDKCYACYNNFGYLKSLLGETVEATRYLEKAIALSATYPEPYFNLGVLYEKGGDIGNAVYYYRQFVSLFPEKNSSIITTVQNRINTLTGK